MLKQRVCLNYSTSQKNVSNLVPFRSMNRLFSFSFVSVTLGSTPKCSLACSCSCVYFSTSSCSNYVWSEQSKNPPSTLPTFVESNLGQWMVLVDVQWNDRMEQTETEPNWKPFFDAYCSCLTCWCVHYCLPFKVVSSL